MCITETSQCQEFLGEGCMLGVKLLRPPHPFLAEGVKGHAEEGGRGGEVGSKGTTGSSVVAKVLVRQLRDNGIALP